MGRMWERRKNRKHFEKFIIHCIWYHHLSTSSWDCIYDKILKWNVIFIPYIIFIYLLYLVWYLRATFIWFSRILLVIRFIIIITDRKAYARSMWIMSLYIGNLTAGALTVKDLLIMHFERDEILNDIFLLLFSHFVKA